MTRYPLLVATAIISTLAACASPPKAPPPGDFGTTIQSALQSGFSGDKAKTLTKLAQAPLNQEEQVYLVDCIASADMFSSDKRQVLMTLINNPAVTTDTLKHIPVMVDQMALFSSDRSDVLEAVTEGLQNKK